MNIRSTVAITISYYLQLIHLFTGTTFLFLTVFSFEKYYKISITNSTHTDPQTYGLVKERYGLRRTTSPIIDECVKEMESVINDTKLFIGISLLITLFIYMFTNIILLVKKSKKTTIKVPKTVTCMNAAMSNEKLGHVKIIV
ncbi:hypothetical protein A0H76_1880 [Hepatospora eriocheir]|uniref:Uncharacterized protein n=1 Tax=Hepatospora eriocheir TaxID=1081669 RepID=A0A1X0QKD6_9MICR|nr:hypothetical protein A0H76_1880 [Hepatospora eriocheir]